MTSINSLVNESIDIHVNNLVPEDDILKASTKKRVLLAFSHDGKDISDQAVVNAPITTKAYKSINNTNKNNEIERY